MGPQLTTIFAFLSCYLSLITLAVAAPGPIAQSHLYSRANSVSDVAGQKQHNGLLGAFCIYDADCSTDGINTRYYKVVCKEAESIEEDGWLSGVSFTSCQEEKLPSIWSKWLNQTWAWLQSYFGGSSQKSNINSNKIRPKQALEHQDTGLSDDEESEEAEQPDYSEFDLPIIEN